MFWVLSHWATLPSFDLQVCDFFCSLSLDNVSIRNKTICLFVGGSPTSFSHIDVQFRFGIILNFKG